MLTFRDRIGITTWVVGFLLALQPTLLTPSWALTWHPLGTPLTLTIGRDTLVGLFLFLALTGGTQWILFAWDANPRGVAFRQGAWALPLAVGWLALRLLPHQPTPRAWGILFVGTLAILALAWHTLVRVIHHVDETYPAGFVWRVLVFVAAGILYLWLYSLPLRSLISATQMLVGTSLLAIALWLPLPLKPPIRWLYGLVAGIVIAQFAWAFHHIPISPLRGGILLMLLFYLVVTVVERAVQERLNIRILTELATITALLFFLFLLV